MSEEPTTPSRCYAFGPFALRMPGRLLTREATPVPLSRRGVAVLALLVEHHDRLVTRDELLRSVWRGRVVQDNNLQVHVVALRKLLGAEAIETVYGVGYRFTLPVIVLPDRRDALVSGGLPEVRIEHRLPSSATSFIGRDVELAALAVLLNETRLLTLTGVGGAGKTRLAVRMLELYGGCLSGGTHIVNVAAMHDLAGIERALAAAFDRRASGSIDLLDHIAASLADREAVLLLDNCEHLLGPCAQTVEGLICRCPSLRVVVTSRAPLGLAGEQRFVVPTMSLPSSERVDDAMAAEAVRLFAQSACFARADFTIDARNCAAVAAICARLDGIPLAIELAAANVALLPVADMAERLTKSLRLLEGNPRGPQRHRTMQAALQWSFDLLTDEEQRLLACLSTFSGGFDLAAAARIGSIDDVDTAFLVIKRLHDKSLVVAIDGEDSARFTMLEVVRQFASDRLECAADAAAVRERHLQFFAELAAARPGERPDAWNARLRREERNIYAALAWAPQSSDVVLGHRLINSLRVYWRHTGQIRVAYGFVKNIAERPAQPVDLALRARTRSALAIYACYLARYDEALENADQAWEMAREQTDVEVRCMVLCTRAFTMNESGDREAALPMAIEARRISSAPGLERYFRLASSELATALFLQGRFADAAAELRLLLPSIRKEHAANVAAGVLSDLACALIRSGIRADVPALLTEAIQTAVQWQVHGSSGALLETIAGLAACLGQHVDASRFVGAARRCADESGEPARIVPRAFHASFFPALRAALGDEACDRFAGEGHAWTVEGALHAGLRFLQSAACQGVVGAQVHDARRSRPIEPSASRANP